VHYVVLHDVFWHGAGYVGYLGADQLAWLAADLARVERGRTVVVCTHIPPHSTRPSAPASAGPRPASR
jgi:3',5'-cyclic AMP phosphodiesterase CpdA